MSLESKSRGYLVRHTLPAVNILSQSGCRVGANDSERVQRTFVSITKFFSSLSRACIFTIVAIDNDRFRLRCDIICSMIVVLP